MSVRRVPKSKSRARYFILLMGVLLVTGSWLLVDRTPEPQQRMAQGIKLESLGRLEEALSCYARIVEGSPDTEIAAEALYRAARIWHHDRREPRRALVKYLTLERDQPESSMIHKSREAAAQIVKYDLRDDVQAIGYYQRLIDAKEGELDRYQYEIADSYFRLENYPQSRIELENLLDNFPDSLLAADALHRKALILMLENRPDDARQDWLRLVEQFPHSIYRSQASFNLAKLQEEQGELEKALERYQQLENFPRPLLLHQKISHLQQRIENRNEAD